MANDTHPLVSEPILTSELQSEPRSKLKPALFIDRDGTLMVEVDHCHDPAKVTAYPGAAEELARARSLGWANIIVTNQSGIGRGYFTVEQFQAVQQELLRQLGDVIDGSYMAPDHPDNPSARRKPAPGMLLEAAVEHGIDLTRSFMIGDKAIDIECGRNAGVRTILVETGYGKKTAECNPDHRAPTVTEAIGIALQSA
jgi:D-glycero-D-manno-heptose 1,7-bisphosphate phosphatase